MSKRAYALSWMKRNRETLDYFDAMAVDVLKSRRECSVNYLREQARRDRYFRKRPHDEPYRFPNDVSPYVARWLLWKHPEFTGRLQCKRTSDEDDGIVLVTDQDIDEAIDQLNVPKYGDYIDSPKWEPIRRRVLRRDDWQCQNCGSTEELEVHHLTYARFGQERLKDLVTLCFTCHRAVHKYAVQGGRNLSRRRWENGA